MLAELMPTILKSNNSICFIEFYGGVFLPGRSTREWVESLERRISGERLLEVENLYGLFVFVVENSSDNVVLKEKIENALIYLSMAQKGLTNKEMLLLTKMTEAEWDQFMGIFGRCIVHYEGLLQVRARWLVDCVMERER